MNSIFYAILACAWAGLATFSFREKHYVSGILQTGIAILDLTIVYLCSK